MQLKFILIKFTVVDNQLNIDKDSIHSFFYSVIIICYSYSVIAR